ncbi:ankyrin repeat domain-containing protein [Hahella sp. KA22]|uniref:ankyrin repeat domain-containing protein n=1 Tax=Hahella sp. KA22 TaxID=1628392 RepID=UPI000FDD487B|nr:ankyrin repeat domain-containing protein [Hahella sp. KA22]AZZ90690.1 ankyrin repeat domain-containing protein [Hahella sp. KA22]QAY54060.1 ankyrin repeat domain-containing protein [Hahella sp. KA22]
MNKSVRALLEQVEGVADFSGVKINDINDTNILGDNALHCVCVWGDLDAAKLLVENGIDIEQKGEGGFTPLRVAEEFGHKELVNYLMSMGADAEALNTEFEFDPEVNSRHLKRLEERIEELSKMTLSGCSKDV